MIRAVLDTNVLVQGLMSRPRSASVKVLEVLNADSFQAVLSMATIEEVQNVLLLPRMRDLHGLEPDDVFRFIDNLMRTADLFDDVPIPTTNTIRDLTDRKFAALCIVSEADYLVTNDRRHLLRLRRFFESRIVTPAGFLRELQRLTR